MYRLGDIEIDIQRACVNREGNEIHLRRKSFQVLTYLVENRDRLIAKDELFSQLWPETAVTDDVLVQCIKDVRRALGDDPHQPRFIKTVPRSGYRFIGPVEEVGRLSDFSEEITRVEFEIEEEIDERPVRTSAFAGALPGRSARRRTVVTVAGLIIACTALVFAYFSLPPTASKADIRLPKIEGRTPVAVMFFENTSGDTELDWLREGLADMLITNLSRSERLTVLSRQQLAALIDRKGKVNPARSIGFDLAHDLAVRSGADAFVSGSFIRAGEKIRVEMLVHNTADSSLRASESLTVERIDDILEQIDIVSLKLARHLGATPSAVDQSLAASMTNNLEAYRLYSLGIAKAHAMESSEAVELLKSAIKLDPEFAMAHARTGYAYAITWSLPEEGKPHLEKAFRLSARTTERDRQNIAAWYAIANRDYAAAIDAYREIVRRYPLEWEGYWRLARLLTGEGRTDEAIDVARQGIAVDPESKNLYNNLGSLLSSLGKHQEAIAAHQRYVALAPNEPNAYDSLGLTYQWAGDLDRAIENFDRALEINPKFDIALIHLAHCQVRRGELRAAAETAERYLAIVEKPVEKARGFDLLSYISLRSGNLNSAEKYAERQNSLAPNRSWPGYLTAVEKGQKERAKKLSAEILAAFTLSERGSRGSPRFVNYYKGMFALAEGRDEEALAHFRETLTHRAPIWHFEDFEDCLGRALLKLGRYDEAIAEFERILQLAPNYPLARFHIARVQRGKGLDDEARASYQRFLADWKTADDDLAELAEARAF